MPGWHGRGCVPRCRYGRGGGGMESRGGTGGQGWLRLCFGVTTIFKEGEGPFRILGRGVEGVRKCLSGVLYGVIGVEGPFDTIFFRR